MKAKYQLILLLLFLFSGFSTFAQPCSVAADIDIVSENSTNVILNVSGLENEDLGVNQAVCGVRIVFEHDQLENIRITLISPSGQEVTLVGPGRIGSAATPLVNWNVLFSPCSDPVSPDENFPSVWDNGAPWAAFSNYTGSYYPQNGCLEDFNMGSANGAWTLQFENLGNAVGDFMFFELIFCDATGSDCDECILFGGNFTFTTPGGIYNFCEGDPAADLMGFSLTQDPILSIDQQYLYTYSRNDTIVKIEDSPNRISDLEVGQYLLCGLAFDSSNQSLIESAVRLSDLTDLIDQRQICAELTNNCITLLISESENTIEIDTSFCAGDTIFFRGIPVTSDLDTSVVISENFNTVCDSVIRFRAQAINIESVIDAVENEINCRISEFLQANNSSSSFGPINNYEWSSLDGNIVSGIGPIAEIDQGGTYELVVSDGICFDTSQITLTSIDTFEIDFELTNPLCFGDSALIEVSFVNPNINFEFQDPNSLVSNSDLEYFTFSEDSIFVESTLGTCVETDTITPEDLTQEIILDLQFNEIDCDNQVSVFSLNTNIADANIEYSGPSVLPIDQTQFDIVEAGYLHCNSF